MKLKIYQVDAFANALFTGNPAAVVLMDSRLPDRIMQSIAAENNLAETAFVVNEGEQYAITWFTPEIEVDLCGHATLAAAHVLFEEIGIDQQEIRFATRNSGDLFVKRKGDLLELNFPMDEIRPVDTSILSDCFDRKPLAAFKGKTDYMAIFGKQEDVEQINMNLSKVADLDARGLIITAPGKQYDFVSRFFAPQCGINEDPVTGSAHTTLTPYWTNVLNQKKLRACQLSKRKGEVRCGLATNRVILGGRAFTYLRGEIEYES